MKRLHLGTVIWVIAHVMSYCQYNKLSLGKLSLYYIIKESNGRALVLFLVLRISIIYYNIIYSVFF